MSKRGDDYIVQPVMKALQVLEHVARQSHEVTLTEIVSELKLPKTTVFRYLQTLSAASFLHHDRKRDRYGVGARFRALAKADKNLQRLRDLAQPEMLGLMKTFNETVNLAILSDRQSSMSTWSSPTEWAHSCAHGGQASGPLDVSRQGHRGIPAGASPGPFRRGCADGDDDQDADERQDAGAPDAIAKWTM